MQVAIAAHLLMRPRRHQAHSVRRRLRRAAAAAAARRLLVVVVVLLLLLVVQRQLKALKKHALLQLCVRLCGKRT